MQKSHVPEYPWPRLGGAREGSQETEYQPLNATNDRKPAISWAHSNLDTSNYESVHFCSITITVSKFLVLVLIMPPRKQRTETKKSIKLETEKSDLHSDVITFNKIRSNHLHSEPQFLHHLESL